MTIRDVETWVEGIMARLASLRTFLSEDVRAGQRETLRKLSTRTIHVEQVQGEPLNYSRKRGHIFELIVKSEPDYPFQTPQERQISEYIKAALRHNYFKFTPQRDWSLSNPDDIIVGNKGAIAYVRILIDMKHSTHGSWKFTPQLQSFITDTQLVVADINRHFEHGWGLPGNANQASWPEDITRVEFDPEECQKILYIPDQRKAAVKNWEVRQSIFSASEVAQITQMCWDQLVAKGGATLTSESETEDKVTVHRSPSTIASVQPKQQPNGGEVVTQASTTREQQFATICGKCEEEPLLYVVREGESNAPFFIVVRGNDGEVRRVFLGQKCAQEHILAEVPKLRAQALEAIGQTEQKFPGRREYTSGRATVDENFRKIVVNDAALPERFLIGLKGLQGLRNRTQLAWAEIWIEDAKSVLEGVSSQRATQVRERLNQLEAKRLDMLRSSGMVQEETVTSFTASPDDEPIEADHVVERVITAYHLFNAAVRFHEDAGKAKVQAENAEHDDETRDDLLAKLSASTGVELKAPEKSKPTAKKAEQPPTVEEAVAAKAKDGGVPVTAVREVGANGDKQACQACGKDNPANRKFCSHCGKLMAEPEPETAPAPVARKCTSCGSSDPGEGNFCNHCGGRVEPPIEEAEEAVQKIVQPELPTADAAALAAVDGTPAAEPAPAPVAVVVPQPKVETETPPAAPTLTPAPASAAANKGFCDQCGNQNRPEAKFCLNCTEALPQVAQ